MIVDDPEFLSRFQRFEDHMLSRFDRLEERIGESNDAGTGGTGLTGEVMRTRTQVQGLLDLRAAGKGIMFALALFGGLLILGVQQWVHNLLDPSAKP